MKLYNNEKEFNFAVTIAYNKLQINRDYIIKDYFNTILLKEIATRVPGILFKGGTSLSKCFDLIDRFSEDIDLSLDVSHFSQSYKRKANKEIIKICDELHLKIINRDDVINRSHSSFNCYKIMCPYLNDSKIAAPYIQIEMAFIQKAYPDLYRNASSLLYKSLIEDNKTEIIKEYELEPFPIKVQSLERTFVDKVFAICDYYLRNEAKRNSRHIYDLYKLLPVIDKTNLKDLVNEVRELRKKSNRCPSAHPPYVINDLLEQIIETNFYKDDYEKVTYPLLIKKVQYKEAIASLYEIIDMGF